MVTAHDNLEISESVGSFQEDSKRIIAVLYCYHCNRQHISSFAQHFHTRPNVSITMFQSIASNTTWRAPW
jgi:hypothetical protein